MALPEGALHAESGPRGVNAVGEDHPGDKQLEVKVDIATLPLKTTYQFLQCS